MDDNALPWTRELINRLGYPFHSARFWGVSFTESDIKYIEAVIKADKLYRVIAQNLNAYQKTQGLAGLKLSEKYTARESFYQFKMRGYMAEIEFFERFFDDEKCPKNVRQFLYFHIGNLRYSIKGGYGVSNDDYTRLSFFTESWLRTVCVRKHKKYAMPAHRKNKKKHAPKIHGIVPKTLQPKLRQNIDNIPTVYMVLVERTYPNKKER